MIHAFLAFITSVTAQAYIPSSQYIIQKTINNHGKGYYRIEQEVTFPFGNDQKVIKETWYSDDGKNFYLLAKGRGFHLERLYVNGKVYAKNSDGEIKKLDWPTEFIEPWFLTTSTSVFRRLITKANIAGPEALNWEPVKKLKEVTSVNDLPLRLSRNRGIVMYAYGGPTPQGDENLKPTLWIEQDKFVIRRLRFSSTSEVVADEYSEYSRDLQFPKTRVLNWESHNVPIRVIQVTSLGTRSKRGKELISYDGFAKSEKNKTLVEENLVNDVIRDFYARFR